MVALSRAFGGKEMITLSPGLAPSELSTSSTMVLSEVGWQMLFAAQFPQASDRTRATFARPEAVDITFPVSSNITHILGIRPVHQVYS